MNKEERVKLVFETISKVVGFEIKPNKEFYIIGNDEKVVYLIDESLNLFYKNNEGDIISSIFSILPIFKGGYELEEIKEQLLTEEEKEFLRHFKFAELTKSTLSHMLNLRYLYMFDNSSVIVDTIYLTTINLSFNGLKENKNYSREELGL